jgi:hypothetical protein
MYLNSRYVNGPVYASSLNDEVVYTVQREFPQPVDYILYKWRPGDRIDWVASSLGIPRLQWWKVMDANPDLRSPTMIQPGQVIRIPRVQL